MTTQVLAPPRIPWRNIVTNTIQERIRLIRWYIRAHRKDLGSRATVAIRFLLVCAGLGSIAIGCATIATWLGWIALGLGFLIIEYVISP